MNLGNIREAPPNTRVVSKDGKLKGKTTGGRYDCQMEGCRGQRIGVRWPDGSITFPCSRGIGVTFNSWRIE